MERDGDLPRIAVFGAGHVGPVIARVAVDAGYDVTIAASAEPERIALITALLIPGAEPRWAADAAAEADVVVLSIPIHKFAAFDPALVAGKVVVDAMNYWPSVDGVQELFEGRRYGSSEIVQQHLDRSMVVKTLDQLGYHDREDPRRPAGSAERRALGVASDDSGALDLVAEIVERVGYDAVRLDSLSAGRLLEPAAPVFGASLGRSNFERALLVEAASTWPSRRFRSSSGSTPSATSPMTRAIAHSHMPRRSGTWSNKVSLPTRSASTSSGSASTTPTTSRCRRPTSFWPRSPRSRPASTWGSAVTVLSSDDPVRVFQRYSTLNAVS